MKEIIPLKKDILFKTVIGKITNINLDHDYKVKDNIVEGFVILSGSYKMMEASVLEDDFSYKIPFGVSISKSIKKDTIKIEIDDFNYKINKDTLSVNIDLEFSCEEEIKEEENIVEETQVKEENIVEETQVKEEVKEEDNKEINIDNISSNIITNEEKYYTYKVYIVRENDTIESICNKYNVLIDDIKEYNDLSNIKIGDKIIIPYINE